jgi:hypothetical protein
MQTQKLFAALVAGTLLVAAPAFAQSGSTTKQPAQEGGGSTTIVCGSAANANPGGDPNCKQRTQNLMPSPGQSPQRAPASAPK